jgi:drug/metabolite transporter (DMT)-like permease
MNSATWIGTTAIVLWSTLGVLTAMTGDIPPFELTAMTFGIGGAIGLGFVAARGRVSHLKQNWRVWCLGIGGLFSYHALYFAALRLAPPAEAGLVNYLWPLLIVLLSSFLPGARLEWRHVAGACLGLAGLAVLAVERLGAPGALGASGPHAWLGYACAFLAAIVWAGYSVLSRLLGSTSSDAVAGFCLGTAGLAALCHLLFETTVVPTGGSQWLALLALGLGPVGAAFYVWDHGMKHGDIRLLAVASYAAPLLSTLLLVLAGFAAASAGLAIACGCIVAGAATASLGGATTQKGRREPALKR